MLRIPRLSIRSAIGGISDTTPHTLVTTPRCFFADVNTSSFFSSFAISRSSTSATARLRLTLSTHSYHTS